MSALRFRGPALAGLALSTLLVLGCEPPAVVPTEDRQQQTVTARIEGNVVVQGPARGNAVVFLYDAARPPPPQGTGRPVSFTIVPQEDIFRSELGAATVGPFTAPFVFPLVRPGRYLLRGFIDTDTCRAGKQPCHGPDFIPWFNVTAEPNVDDVGGAAVDPATLQPRVIEVGVSDNGMPVPVLGVSVSFSSVATVLADRPAFEVETSSPRFAAGETQKLLKLRVRPIRAGAVDLRSPVFLVRYMDENGDREPDDLNRDGTPELWPRVVLRKLADGAPLTDENDLDNNGELDMQGVDYVRMSGSPDGQPDLVVLASSLVADAFLPQLNDNQGLPSTSKFVEATELTVAVRPIGVDARNPAAPVILRTVPPGRYAVIVLQSTGQVWRVPNELSPELAEPRGLPPLQDQAFFVEVP
jgi:hypothetical protein